MVLAAELDPEGHHDAGDVSSAVDGVAAGQCEQGGDRIRLLLGRRTHLPPPGVGCQKSIVAVTSSDRLMTGYDPPSFACSRRWRSLWSGRSSTWRCAAALS